MTAPVTAASPGVEGIITPEAVLLEFAAAGLGSRALAFVIDLAIRGAVVWTMFIALAAGGLVFDETLVVVLSIATVFGALLVYPVACETVWNGRTPGKMVMGLRAVTTEGSPVRFRHAAIRSALGLVDFLLGAGAFAILSALFTRQSQRLGDLAAGTIVIRERQASRDQRAVAFRPPPGWEPYASALDVTALGDEGYGLIRTFLLRVRDLDDGARRARSASLADAVAARIDVPFPAGTDPEAFLVTVAAAHQARSAGLALTGPPLGATGAAVPPPVGAGPDGSGIPGVGAVPPPVGKGVVPPSVLEVEVPTAAWGRPD